MIPPSKRPAVERAPRMAALLLLALPLGACVSRPLDRGPSPAERLATVLERSDRVQPERLARELRSLSLASPRHVPTLVADAAVSIETGRSQRARALLDTALRLEPGHVDATVLSVRLASEAGDLAGAERRIEAALVLRPDAAELYESRAALAFLDARYSDATRALDRAHELTGEETWSVAYHRGLVAEARGDRAGAEEAFRRCVELEPGFEPAARRLRALESQRSRRERP